MRCFWMVLALTALMTAGCGGPGQAGGEAPGYADLVARSQPHEGFFDLHWDEKAGKLYLTLEELDSPFLYATFLARGVGSNDLGLDRGQLSSTRLVRFQRSGPRVLLVQDNLAYRAASDNAAELAAVDESFAFSVLGGFDVLAEASDGELLIDATDFFLRDAHNVGARLAEAEEGTYKADPTLSSIYLGRTRSFPDNTEIEAVVTLTGEPEGRYLSTVVPDPRHLSVHIHHSLVRLPAPGFEPVEYDSRAGYIEPHYGGYYADYSTPISEPVERALLPRHRLRKKDPEAALSEPVEPIVYYLDRGAPEPVRSALLEGAQWWNQAFEAAGYKDAFRVELLPEGADPLDVRYNVIQWVHRATRGWSYGTAVVDPRTAEIIKGHVTLGSLRVRQDYLLAEGLLAPYDGSDRSAELEAFALARLRQLSAHEVGHTLGLAHNFAASADGRASVMDYPHPLIRFDAQGGIDLDDAYGVGVGAWDKRSILYGYQDFPAGVDAAEARAGILADTLDSGLHFVADAHARDPGSAHPLGSLWDNGSNAVDELRRLLQVRRTVLNNFSEAVIRQGRPMSRIEDVLVPMYLLHRYQLQAAGKLLGGQTFAYASRGDGQQPITEPVPAAEQRRALEALLDTIQPEVLALPPGLVRLIPPRAPGVPVTRELFDRATGDVFDPVAPAEAASRLTLEVLLHPERAARMNRLGATDPGQPEFRVVLDGLLERSWMKPRVREDDAVLQRAINDQVLEGLLDLFRTEEVTPQVRALAVAALLQIAELESTSPMDTPDWRAHFAAARRLVERELDEAWPERRDRVSPPPGSPIGAVRG